MVLRGFGNDNTSRAPQSSNGFLVAKAIDTTLRRGGKTRAMYDSIGGVPELRDLQGVSGKVVASFVLGIVDAAYPEYSTSVPDILEPTTVLSGIRYVIIPSSSTTSTTPTFRRHRDELTDLLSQGI